MSPLQARSGLAVSVALVSAAALAYQLLLMRLLGVVHWYPFAAMIVSLALLGLALKTLPVGTAYAVWTGIGAVGTAALGIYLFGEPTTAARLASIGLIVAGIVGLKLVT